MLPNYKTILVPTDFTPNSGHAFRHAVILARQNSAQIHLLHVVPDVDASVRSYVATVMGKGRLDAFEKEHEEEARRELTAELDAFAKAELAGHAEDLERFAGSEVVHGHPVAQILLAADRLDADVIVMGSHGKGPLEYSFLGSVAEKVLRKSRRPVFVVPLPE